MSEKKRPTGEPSACCVDPDGFFNLYGTFFEREDNPTVSDADIDSATQRYYQTQSLPALPAIRLPS